MSTTQQQTQHHHNSNPPSTSNQASLSFDDVSKLFNLPLSDAAETLGVCTSVLKKLCHDNGLVRWPYRKFLSGKSVEEIKKDVAQERNQELADQNAAGERHNAFASSAVTSSLSSQLQNKSTSSIQEMPKSRGVSQQQGNNRIQNGSYSSNLAKGIPAILDEFKYGFPSCGLSTSSCRWWGSHSSDGSIHRNGGVDVGENNRQSNELVDEVSELLSMDREISASGTDGSNFSHQGMGSLSVVRKRAADEGREALKLGVYRGYGVNKLAKRERMLLRRIFEPFSRF